MGGRGRCLGAASLTGADSEVAGAPFGRYARAVHAVAGAISVWAYTEACETHVICVIRVTGCRSSVRYE